MMTSLRFVRIERRKSTRSLIAAAFFCLIILAGCGGSSAKSTPTAAPPATVVAASPTATPAPATLGKIVWAATINPETFAPNKKASSFAPEAPVIYAVVPVKGVTPGLTLTANWTYNDTPLQGVSSTVIAGQPTAIGWVEFHLTLAAGQSWPTGTYKITVNQLNGASATAKTTVKRAGS